LSSAAAMVWALPAPALIWKESHNYIKDTELGKGGFAKVYRAFEYPSTDTPVALKCLTKGNTAAQRNVLVKEYTFQREVHSPHVLAVYNVAIVDNQPCLAMELASNGSVRNWLKERGKREGNAGMLTKAEAKPIITQMLLGIQAVHDANMAHRDIKPSNFLRGNDGVIKITDFGLSVYTDGRSTDKEVDRRRGTPGFRALEMYEDEPIQNLKALDIYSMGISLWQLLGGLRNPRYYDRGNIGLDGLEGDLIYRMTNPDPDSRPTIAEVLADKWLAAEYGETGVGFGEDAARVQKEWWQNSSSGGSSGSSSMLTQHPFSLMPVLWQDMLVSWA